MEKVSKIMKPAGFFTLILFCLLLAGCNDQSPEKHLEYRSFEFNRGDLLIWTKETSGPESIKDPMPYYDLGQLLTRLDARGWKFIWTDGRQCIVRRVWESGGQNDFIISKNP